MANIIQVRRDLAANWTSTNPILAQGEIGFETDTLKIKFGDGSTAWTSLAYYQAQIDAHIADTANPHTVTAAQVGLGNVDNTSDADKPVSTAQQTALDLKLDNTQLKDTAYGAAWDGDTTSTASRNAIYDKIESLSAGGGSDASAIHDDTSGEIAAITSKAVPVDGDFLIIEDSAAGNVKKKITIGDLPSSGGGGGSGDVVGPASATDNAIARYDLTTGKLLQDSGVLVDDSNNVSGVNALTVGGELSAMQGFATTQTLGTSQTIKAGMQTSVVIGDGAVNNPTVANGQVLIGQGASITGSHPDVTIGKGASNTGTRSITIGRDTSNSGSDTVVIGTSTTGNGANIFGGNCTDGGGNNNTMIGSSITFSNAVNNRVAIGSTIDTGVHESISIGTTITNSSLGGIIIGKSLTSSHANTILIGKSVSNTAAFPINIGDVFKGNPTSGDGEVAGNLKVYDGVTVGGVFLTDQTAGLFHMGTSSGATDVTLGLQKVVSMVGSKSSPALRMGTDTNTGFYAVASNTWSFAQGGVTKWLACGNSGLVGAGQPTQVMRFDDSFGLSWSTDPDAVADEMVLYRSASRVLGFEGLGGQGKFDCDADLAVSGNVDFSGLPTSDPAVTGRLWNDAGTLKISA